MTHAEIIKGLKAVRTIHNGNYAPYIDGAIKELKDRDCVLDKIRAEIDEQYDRVHPYNISCAEGLEIALDIIDKYMAEGSDKK
jgi:hypothetical protein